MSQDIGSERRLAAVLAADVAGFSRLTEADEIGTLRMLTAQRAILDSAIARHRGRIANTAGDSVLAEFPSAVNAVQCAVEAQQALREAAEVVEPADRRVLFRIGIHVGDVMVHGGDLLGNGVNVAARLEALADAGGIVLSAAAHEQVKKLLPLGYTDLGAQSVKNIEEPVRAFAIGASANTPQVTPLPSFAPHLSLVVLPFANISGDPQQDYFVDGVTESLTTDLSRISGAFVIARNTAYAFKGKPVDVKKLGRELNVRYALEGSLQRGGNRLRVNVQLIDTETGSHLWAERFDKTVADVFEMQDEIVARLANALDAELIAAEARRAERSTNPDVMDLVYQGRALFNSGWTLEYMERARSFFERAIALDPGSVEALVGLALVNDTLGAVLLANDPPARFADAEAASTKALHLAPNHVGAHLALGVALMFTKRAVRAIAEFEHVLTLDRNSAMAHSVIGFAKYLLGRGSETEAHINEALRLSPRDPSAHRWLIWVGVAKVAHKAETEAVAWLRRGLEANQNYSLAHFNLAAVLARLNQMDEARVAVRAGLALDPTFSIGRFRSSNAWSDDPAYLAGRERQCESMRLAGVPE